jgi:hypothetical protein
MVDQFEDPRVEGGIGALGERVKDNHLLKVAVKSPRDLASLL